LCLTPSSKFCLTLSLFFSEHKCNGGLLRSYKSTSQLKSESNLDRHDESDENEGYGSLSKREKNRKQWKKSADNIQHICDSYCKLHLNSESDKGSNLAEYSRHRSRSRRSACQLPPLQHKNIKRKDSYGAQQDGQVKKEEKNVEIDSSDHKEISKSKEVVNHQKSNNYAYEYNDTPKVDHNLRSESSLSLDPAWIVRKPEKNKPQDHLKLEGKMDLETTFKSTIGLSAEQIMASDGYKSVSSSRASKVADYSQDTQQVNQSGRPLKRRYRPQTSLKLGGEGYFHTLNQDTYKNFVIIDQKKKAEQASESKTEIKSNLVNNKSERNSEVRSDQKAFRNQESTTTKDIIHTNLQRSDKKQKKLEQEKEVRLPKVDGKEEKLQRSSSTSDFVNSSSNEGVGMTADSDATVTIKKDTQRLRNRAKMSHSRYHEIQEAVVNNQVRRTPIRPTSSLTVSGKFKGSETEQAVGQKRHYKLGNKGHLNDNVNEIMNSNWNETEMISSSSVDYKWNNNVSHTHQRSQSLPRSRLRAYKNDSQLKFDGQMDFETTSNQFFRNYQNKRSVPKPSGQSVQDQRRDLFRTSSEVHFNSESAFDKSTTYNDQFRNQLYCPAIDLGTSKSHFEYKGEAGGHQFYHQCIQY